MSYRKCANCNTVINNRLTNQFPCRKCGSEHMVDPVGNTENWGEMYKEQISDQTLKQFDEILRELQVENEDQQKRITRLENENFKWEAFATEQGLKLRQQEKIIELLKNACSKVCHLDIEKNTQMEWISKADMICYEALEEVKEIMDEK